MIRNAQAFLIIIFMSACSLWINHTPAKAGGGGRTHAIADGIGYRSNLIDPLNPYAVPGELILGELLRRYEFLSETLDLGKMPAKEIEKHATGADQTINRDRYLEKLFSFIPNPELKAEITATTPQYDYGYGACESNNFKNVYTFITKAATDLNNAKTIGILALVRHLVLALCDQPSERRQKSAAIIRKILNELITQQPESAPWVYYLRGAISLYLDEDDLG